jgi:hypothetical protein
VWRCIYESNTSTNFAKYTPAAEDKVRTCNKGKSDPGDSKQLDFGKGWAKSRWNTRILQNIYDAMIIARAEQGSWGVPAVSEGYVMGELFGQLKRSQEAWVQVQPRFSLMTGNIETEDQQLERVTNDTVRRSQAAASRGHHKRVRAAALHGVSFTKGTDRNLRSAWIPSNASLR